MLDWGRISELRGEVGDAEFQVILEMFLDEVESAMMRLSPGDAKRLETSLHFSRAAPGIWVSRPLAACATRRSDAPPAGKPIRSASRG